MFRHRQALSVLLVLSSSAFAQVQRPPVLPTAPIPPPIPASGNRTPVRLQFPNADVKDVLNLYQKIADVRLVYDNQVVGPVNIFIEGDLPADEAKLIIEINLLMNGFTLVPVEGTRIVKVIGIGKSPRTAGIRIISDELQIPPGEEVVTYLAKLRYADPQEVTQVLGTFVVQSPGQYTNITPLPKSSALLITENSAILRGIVKVIHEMDQPPAEVVDKFIPLERADAEDVQKKLLDIFQKSPTQGQTTTPGGGAGGGAAAAARPAARPPMPDGSPAPEGVTAVQTGQSTIELSSGALTEDSVIVGKITLTADKRTNRIHVVTRPINMRFVEKLIREFDQDVKFGEPSIRKLKYVSASDIFQVVVKSISDPGAQDQTTGGGTTPRPATTTQPRGDNFNRAGGAGGLGGGLGGGGGSQTLSESLSAEERDIVPEAVTVGNSRLIADKRANAIIVLGNQEVKDKVFRVIDELDVRAPQVLLHTVIGQLSLGKDEQFGVNYFISKANELGQNPRGAQTGTAAGGLNNLFGLASIVGINNGAPSLNLNNLLLARNFQTAVTAGSVGLSGFVAAGNSLDVILNALASTNKFRVTARPSIFTSNNKKAIISSGEEIAIPTNIQSGFNGGGVGVGGGLVTNSQIQFKTVALQLEVLPLINADREVSLDVVQKLDEVVGTTKIDNNDIPRIATRVLQTSVSVPNQSTLVLGGLIRQSNTKTQAGIPYLSKIPVLGALFRSNRDETTRSELVIFIRPEVTFGPREDIGAREREQEFLHIPPDLESGLYPRPERVSTTSKKMLRKPSAPLRDWNIEYEDVPQTQPARPSGR